MDTIPAAYALAIDILEDQLIARIHVEPRRYDRYDCSITEEEGDSKLLVLLEKLERRGMKNAPLTRLKSLEKLYNKYTKLSRQKFKDPSRSSARNLARGTITLMAEFLHQEEQ